VKGSGIEDVRLEVIHSSETIRIVLKSSEITPIGIVPVLCHIFLLC